MGWNTGNFAASNWHASNWYFPDVGGFPTQYDGLHYWDGFAVQALCLVEEADAPLGMGGVWQIQGSALVFAVYLVETSDPDASPVHVQTTTGVKAARFKT